ncbi:MAG TPA: hypothetical protein VJS30_21635, partial [Paraburkholderia sp.]|nr:hypothetical protein [Paraburkholderia sp.]
AAVDIHATSSPRSGPMSCAARYSETTSLEFILNLFEFFFTQKSRLIEAAKSTLGAWPSTPYNRFPRRANFTPQAHDTAPHIDARAAKAQPIQCPPNCAAPHRRRSSPLHRTHGFASRAQLAAHTCNAMFVTARAPLSGAGIDDLFARFTRRMRARR